MKFLGKKSATLLVALLSVCTPAQARKGGIGDGGGEQVTAESNPWRVGPSPIEYCIQRADGFPQSRADLSQLVAESFRDWQAFFSKYEMNRPFRGSDTAAKYALPASAREVAACTDVRSQIRFLFGVTNAETLRYKARYADRVIGFAHRTNYDRATFQGSGVVWISANNAYEEHTGAIVNHFPDWTWRTSLKHQLLHEIGHVFGMPHNSTWVMDSEVLHTQLWATMRHQTMHLGDDALVPLGTIETDALVFDPLSGTSDVGTCAGFHCRLAPKMPAPVQKALGLSLAGDANPEVRIRFATKPRGSGSPTFQMTVSVPSANEEKTVSLRAQVLREDEVPRLYVSGAYALDAGWLRQVYGGTFGASLAGLPLMITVDPMVTKITFYDVASDSWQDWFALSAPYVEDPNQ